KPIDYYDSTSGKFGDGGAGSQSWAMLGMLALKETIPPISIGYLKSLSINGNSWEWSSGWGADTNTTALATQALLANHDLTCQPLMKSILAYFHQAQNNDGGFPFYASSTASDADSTAYVLQALYALGEDPTSDAWKKNGKTPLDFLASVQLSDGSFEWMQGEGSNLMATQQVIPALLGRPAPFTTTGTDPCWNAFLPLIHR
ncbi:MAG: hypothetical protein ACPL3P_04875, partial [Anaerolineales bacterium]